MQINIPGLSTTVVLIPSYRGNGSTEVAGLILHVQLVTLPRPLCFFVNLIFVSLMQQVPGGWSFITDQLTAPGPSGPLSLRRPPCCCSLVLLTPYTSNKVYANTHAQSPDVTEKHIPSIFDYFLPFCFYFFDK